MPSKKGTTMVFIAAIGRHCEYDAPDFVDGFLSKEKFIQDKVGETLYQANVWDFRYMILTGFWSRDGKHIVESVTPLWTEAVGQYYYDLGYPFRDPNKRFLKTLYWHIVREYTVCKAAPNKFGGKCQHPDCSCPTSRQLNVHHGSISGENYVSLEKGFQPIVGQEHLHEGMLSVLCETCHIQVTEKSRLDKMMRPRTISSKNNPKLLKQFMNNLSGNRVVDKRDVESSTIMTIGEMIKYKQEKKDQK